MKFKSILSLAVILMFVSSCTDIALIDIDIELKSGEVVVFANSVSDTVIEKESLPIDKSTLDANGVSVENIKEVKIKEAILTVTSPDPGNFNWAKSATVIMKSPGLPDLTVGEITDVPTETNPISVVLINSDVEAYVTAPSFTVSIRVETDEPILVDHKITVKLITKVKA